MLQAVRDGDQSGYVTALRSTKLTVLFRNVVEADPQLLMIEYGEHPHVATFTSKPTAALGLERLVGADTAGWIPATYEPEKFTSEFLDMDLNLVIDPTTPLERQLTVSQIVDQWIGAGLTRRPRRRRGSFLSGVLCLLVAACLLVVSARAAGPVRCGSAVMGRQDTCVETSGSTSTERDYEQTATGQRRFARGVAIAGGVMAVVGLYLVGARILTSIPRRE